MNVVRKPVFGLVAAASLALGGCATTAQPQAGGDDFLANMLSGRSAMTGEALATAVAEAAAYPLGSRENPVRAAMPQGQRAYLARLSCADGFRPKFARRGSAGMSPYGNIIDVYQVECENSTPASSDVFLDMYHPGHIEAEAIPGFGISEPRGPNGASKS